MDKVDDKEKPTAAGELYAPDKKRMALSGKRFVLTAAQNNTYVHKEFLDSIKTFCAHNDAELVVAAFTYNKNGFQNDTKDDSGLWYDPSIKEYIINDDVFVTPWDDLVFCASLNILPTAVNPLSGLSNYCQGASGIVPHAKVRMESLPRMKKDPPRFMYTTGAVTLRNYVQKKAGQKAEFHHVFGALYVEVNEQTGDWHARQLIAGNNGVFQDLCTVYTPQGLYKGTPVEAINWGDIHAEKMDDTVAKASWGYGDSLLETLQPKYQFVHDLTDFTARNHHNVKDPYFLAKQYFSSNSSVEKDLERSVVELLYMSREQVKTIVVDSNHDHALTTWLKTAHKSITQDPENASVFHRLNHAVFEAIKLGNTDFNVYAFALNQIGKEHGLDVDFLGEDESFVICKEYGGIECGIHGHKGPNGSRGSPNALKNIGKKLNTGHTHSAGIIDGVYTAGVSASLDLGYNKGPSSWSNSHIVTYPNGKRCIVTIKNGAWR